MTDDNVEDIIGEINDVRPFNNNRPAISYEQSMKGVFEGNELADDRLEIFIDRNKIAYKRKRYGKRF